MATVAIVDSRTAFERDTVVTGAVEMCLCVKVMNLLSLQSLNGVVVHLAENVGVLLSAANTSRGDEVCLMGKSLSEENLISCAYDAAVVEIYVVDKEPCSQAVGCKGAAFLRELHDVFVEKQSCLIF